MSSKAFFSLDTKAFFSYVVCPSHVYAAKPMRCDHLVAWTSWNQLLDKQLIATRLGKACGRKRMQRDEKGRWQTEPTGEDGFLRSISQAQASVSEAVPTFVSDCGTSPRRRRSTVVVK